MKIDTLLKLTTSYEKYSYELKVVKEKNLEANFYTQVSRSNKLGAFFERILADHNFIYPLDAKSMAILLADNTSNIDEIVEIIDNQLVYIAPTPIFNYTEGNTYSIDSEITINEIKNALDCSVKVYLYAVDNDNLGKFCGKIIYDVDATIGLLKLVRVWNSEWESFSFGKTKDKPKSFDELVNDINSKYVVTIKQSIK